MIRYALWPLCLATLFVASPVSAKRTAEDRLKGRIILSTQPFPVRFKSDAAMVKQMKRAHTKGFWYDEKGYVDVEMMAFFASAHRTTEFTAAIYDVTDGRRLVHDFAIYPATTKPTRLIASNFRLKREEFEAERRYLIVITPGGVRAGYIAKAEFSLKRPRGEKDAKVVPTTMDLR